MMIRLSIVMLLLGAVFLVGCSSSKSTSMMTARERFEHGKKLFDKGDYLEARKDFEQIKLQFPGNSVADDAQYYLAECYFNREEFLLAAEEYKSIKRSQQGSRFLPAAQYKLAMCFYNLAPESHLDQDYTVRAIDAFQAFLEYYPTHEMVPDATKKIQELNNRLAQKDFESGELYLKLEYYKSAAYYFTTVVEKFFDTPYAELAQFDLAKALAARKHYAEAKKEIDKFILKYPHSDRMRDVESLKDDVEKKLQSVSELSGRTNQPAR